MGAAERLLPESPRGGWEWGGPGTAWRNLPGALEPSERGVPSQQPQAVWVHYVQNCLVPPHSLKEKSFL